jgi:hypothetical protein
VFFSPIIIFRAVPGFLFVMGLALSFPAHAWNPFSQENATEVPLSQSDLQKVKVNAGWAKGEELPLFFEVTNDLKGPIQCSAANVELNDGKTVSKVFVPKFAIPGQSTRNATMLVVKGTMKAYALTCSCFKKKGSEACVNPLK